MRDGRITQLAFYLAEVAAFVKPVAVIPDVGGLPNTYLMLRSRTQWKQDFISWLRKPYEDFPDFEEDNEDLGNYEEDEE